MKREEIIKIAHDCGMWDNPQQFAAFAAAIEARTREKCAVIAENRSTTDAYEIAHNIRALP